MLESIEYDWFKCGEIIKVHFDEASLALLEIYKVKKSPYPKYKESVRDPFSLIIRGAKAILFNPGYYDIEHISIGKVEMYMTPILAAEGDDINYYYEIMFA